jgi:hypothetical protein
MSRDHTMFIQAQDLPWRHEADLAGFEGLEVKSLSEAARDGARTCLVRIPAGWSAAARSGWLDVLDEFYVLDGDLTLSDQLYVHDCYACLPAGFVRREVSSRAGAVLLLMRAARARWTDGAVPPEGSYDASRLVAYHNAFERGLDGWEKNTHTRYLPGTGVQTLRADPVTREITILYAALPFRFMDKRWTHEHVQEMFVLAGEYAINDVGVLRPGGYAWWEPEYLHGPYGSLTGFMMLIRSCGGPLVNVIPDERVPVDYAAPFRPVLPAALGALAREPAPFTRY